MVVIDPAAIDELVTTFGDEGRVVVGELVATFLSEAPARLDAIRQGVAAADEAEVRRAAHSLKAGAATLGAHQLAEACRQVEARSRAGDLAAAADLVPAVEASYDQARRALEDLVG
ncbi:MAG TPA: Hpt domain-containing protein [Acidimicrobiales bacterium]